MKTENKMIVFIILVAAIFFAGSGLRWGIDHIANGKITKEHLVKADSPTQTLIPISTGKIEPTLTAPTQTGAIDPGADLKRGSFFSPDVDHRLGGIIQEQDVSGVRLQVSKIVRQSTRAFARVCMQAKDGVDPLDFGTTDLEYPGGRAKDFFVNPSESSDGVSRCLVLEFVGIPVDAQSQDWKFTMEWVGFVAPDEGTECEAFERRAQSSAAVQQNQIQFSCDASSGQPVFGITAKPAGLSDAQALEIVDKAVTGVVSGPWSFSLPVE